MSKDEMIALGFKYEGTCNCDQTTNFKYSKGEYLFYVRLKRRNFHVKQGMKYIKKHEDLLNLYAVIKNLFPEKVLESTNAAST